MVQVQKSDGHLEEFDQNKITSGVIKSGGTPEQANQVLDNVKSWVGTAAQNGVVLAKDVKVKVVDALKSLNQMAAEKFQSYTKPKQS